jgi:hypothetical protein
MIYTIETEQPQSTFNNFRYRKSDTLRNTGQNLRSEMQFSRKNLALLTDLNFKFTDAVTRLQWAQYLAEGQPMTRIIM